MDLHEHHDPVRTLVVRAPGRRRSQLRRQLRRGRNGGMPRGPWLARRSPVSPRRNALAGAVDDALVALSDPTRWQVLTLLAMAGEATATSLAARMPVSRPAIAGHLAILHRAGLVRSRRKGREVRFHVRPERLEEAARWVSRAATEWKARRDGLASGEAASEALSPRG